MNKLHERLKRCTPYLRVATLVSRETIYDLMMQTDLPTVYTMRAVMLIGMGTYEHNEVHPAVYPCKLFGETMDMMPVFLPPSMEKELKDMLNLKDFRKYITAGMTVLGIY